MSNNKQIITENTARIEEITRRLNSINIGGESGEGGGTIGIGTGEYWVRVIDYDGTVLDIRQLNTGDVYTLPEPPTHDGLVFDAWSCSQPIDDGKITIDDDNVMIGATYTTASKTSEFGFVLTLKTGLDVVLNMDGVKNWGDGTIDDTNAHTYADYGEYVVSCDGSTITTNSDSGLFGQSMTAKNGYCAWAHFGKNVTAIGSYAFAYCNALSKVLLPQNLRTIGYTCFYRCYALRAIVIPSMMTGFGDNSSCFRESFGLHSIVIPYGVSRIGDECFMTCYSLRYLVLPKTITTLRYRAFYDCRSLSLRVVCGTLGSGCFYMCSPMYEIKAHTSVGTISSYAFDSCYGVKKYDFTSHGYVPTLEATYAFSGINTGCKIYVPDSLYSQWIAASNWSSYADYIYGASDMTD